MCQWHDWIDQCFCRRTKEWDTQRNKITIWGTYQAWQVIQTTCKRKALGCLKNLFVRNDSCQRMHLESEESVSGDVSAKHLKTIWIATGANKKDVNVNQWVEEVQAKLQKIRHP